LNEFCTQLYFLIFLNFLAAEKLLAFMTPIDEAYLTKVEKATSLSWLDAAESKLA
jgi:hypothetical protein